MNPTIEWLSDETEANDEGCLSFPGIFVPIKRSLRARVRATGLDGQEFVAPRELLLPFLLAFAHERGRQTEALGHPFRLLHHRLEFLVLL